MQLKNRIKTIERKVNINTSDFCRCYGSNLKYEVVPITIDEWKRRFGTGEETITRLPDFCDECRKPIDKRFIERTFEQTQEIVRQRLAQVGERNGSPCYCTHGKMADEKRADEFEIYNPNRRDYKDSYANQ